MKVKPLPRELNPSSVDTIMFRFSYPLTTCRIDYTTKTNRNLKYFDRNITGNPRQRETLIEENAQRQIAYAYAYVEGEREKGG